MRRFLELNYAPLRAAGYSQTVVPDRRVFAYNTFGAAIELRAFGDRST